MWAGQIERKVRRISDPMLHEDLMDHLSCIVKQASQGQWSVNTIKSPTFTITKAAKSPVTWRLYQQGRHVGLRRLQKISVLRRLHQSNNMSLPPPPSKCKFNLRIIWWPLCSGSTVEVQELTLPQAPQAEAVSQSAALLYPGAAEYANLATVTTVLPHQHSRPS